SENMNTVDIKVVTYKSNTTATLKIYSIGFYRHYVVSPPAHIIKQLFNMRRHTLKSYRHTTSTFNSQNLNGKKKSQLPDEVLSGNIVNGLKEKPQTITTTLNRTADLQWTKPPNSLMQIVSLDLQTSSPLHQFLSSSLLNFRLHSHTI
ncbi:hypothetical protein DOY81_002659, partial [Sarcophaga bullata]